MQGRAINCDENDEVKSYIGILTSRPSAARAETPVSHNSACTPKNLSSILPNKEGMINK